MERAEPPLWRTTTFSEGFCEIITNLQGSGGAYLAFSLFTIVVLLVWTIFFVLQILKKKFPGPKWLAYLFPVLALGLNFIANAALVGASEAKFKDKCDVMSLADKEDICTADLALPIFLFLISFRALFMGSPSWQAVSCRRRNLMQLTHALNQAPKAEIEFRIAEIRPKYPVILIESVL
jgi:hypothetical protein